MCGLLREAVTCQTMVFICGRCVMREVVYPLRTKYSQTKTVFSAHSNLPLRAYIYVRPESIVVGIE